MNGYVYLIFDGIYYKIGHTDRNPKLRLQEAQIYNSSELILVFQYKTIEYKKLEHFLHRRFHSKHIRGEWFNLTLEDVNSFDATCKLTENNIRVLSESTY